MTYRARNAFGASIVDQAVFYLLDGAVVYTHSPGALHPMVPNSFDPDSHAFFEIPPNLLDLSVGPLTPEEARKAGLGPRPGRAQRVTPSN